MAITVPYSPDDRPPTAVEIWRTSLEHSVKAAQEAMPDHHTTIAEGLRLVSTGRLELLADGLTARLRHPDGTTPWVLNGNGQCPCDDPGWCPHKLARALLVKTMKLCQDAGMSQGPPVDAPDVEDEVAAAPGCPIPAQYLVSIHNKQFILYTGLRSLAGQRGLLSIVVEPITITPELGRVQGDRALQGRQHVDRDWGCHAQECGQADCSCVYPHGGNQG